MNHNISSRLIVPIALVVAWVVALPTSGAAQTVTGQARAVQVSSVLGTATLADTGTLGSATDARESSLGTGRVPSILSGEVLRAVTLGSLDRVASETSLANLTVKLGATSISAGLVVAQVRVVHGENA